jgi:cysteine desulfurase
MTTVQTTIATKTGVPPAARADSNAPKRPVYLDYQATTPMDPRVLDAMMPFFTEKFGNPHSRNHHHGWEAEEAVEHARKQVADLIGADEREIVFTSGATESNNLAISGVAHFYKDRKNHIVTLVTEHKCVLDTCRHLEMQGFKVTYLPVKKDGLVDLDVLKNAITDKTVVVSVMGAHNEIGVLQPLKEIGEICRSRGVFFHTDCAQAFGKIPLDVNEMKIDLMSISGHKIYGPKGIGALYVRRKPRVRLVPLIHGGGQERGFRSGTLPTPLCVGLGRASALAGKEMASEASRLLALRERLFAGLRRRLPDLVLNGDPARRLPGNLNLAFPGIDAERLLEACEGLALSTGSACSSAEIEPSYVLRALGLSETLARGAIRIGLGRFTTEAEIDYAVDALAAGVQALAPGGRVTSALLGAK